jgi:hypothetical protein
MPSVEAAPVELRVEADVETGELVPIGPTGVVAAGVRPFGENPPQFYRRSECSDSELLPQLLNLRTVHERGIGGDRRAQFVRHLMHIVDGSVDDRACHRRSGAKPASAASASRIVLAASV